jgi:hypothetical protein
MFNYNFPFSISANERCFCHSFIDFIIIWHLLVITENRNNLLMRYSLRLNHHLFTAYYPTFLLRDVLSQFTMIIWMDLRFLAVTNSQVLWQLCWIVISQHPTNLQVNEQFLIKTFPLCVLDSEFFISVPIVIMRSLWILLQLYVLK